VNDRVWQDLELWRRCLVRLNFRLLLSWRDNCMGNSRRLCRVLLLELIRILLVIFLVILLLLLLIGANGRVSNGMDPGGRAPQPNCSMTAHTSYTELVMPSSTTRGTGRKIKKKSSVHV
jgi:hypothetical protein